MAMKRLLTFATVVVLALICMVVVYYMRGDDGLPFSTGDVTVRNIAKTEKLKVLTIHKDVLSAQHRITKGLFSDTEDKLYVIYPASLNFGFDLSECDTSSVRHNGDTLVVTLPSVKILNTDVKSIDEAGKHTAIETGEWSPAEMMTLRERAAALMLRACEYDSCYAKAERVAVDMVALMAKRFGFNHVVVNITHRDSYGLALLHKTYSSVTPYRFYSSKGHSYLAFPNVKASAVPKLYYYDGNMSQQQLLALGDFFSSYFRSLPCDVEVLIKGADLLVLFRHDNITANSREAIQITKNAKPSDVEPIRSHVAKDIFQNAYNLRISHVDRQKKSFYSY